ncbi:MAG TPA: hypothetical protein VII13_16325 [Vicinamibacteria bacterium]|jgi:hypothetical protein
MAAPLSPAARFWLWDYARGSRAYEAMWVLLLLVLVLVPSAFWRDPLQERMGLSPALRLLEAASR